MDELDKKILNALMENSRLSLRQIAKKAEVSVGTVLNRLRLLENNKTIKKYTALIDYEKAGYAMDAIISLTIIKGKYKEVYDKIVADPRVMAAYDVTGETDSIIIAKFKNKSELDRFLKKIQGFEFIERTRTQIILNTVKEEPPLIR